jgi:vancomycin aglycone glucosyltransferase
MNAGEFLVQTADAVHSGGVRFLQAVRRFGEQSAELQFDRLPEATRDVDRILSAGTTLAASSMAELHRVAFRFVVYTPGLLPSREHTPVMFPFQLRGRRINRLLRWATRQSMNAIARSVVSRHRAALGLPAVEDLYSHLLSERPIVAVDRVLAPVPPDCPLRYDQIRCLHPLDGDVLPEKLESFLRSGPPPVYLGFGSMPDPQPTRTTRQLLESVVALGCRALISRGWAELGDGPLPEGVMAIGPVSHASLCPRVSAVVHHGGAGTTHSAARAGVPQIVVPHVLDQYYFARRVTELGVGPPALARKRLTASRLTGVLRATLGNEWLVDRAKELRQRLVELGPAEPDPESIL